MYILKKVFLFIDVDVCLTLLRTFITKNTDFISYIKGILLPSISFDITKEVWSSRLPCRSVGMRSKL